MSTSERLPHAGARLLRSAILIIASLVLAACGGGGGSSTSISVDPGSLTYSGTSQAAPQTQIVTIHYKGDGVLVGYPPGATPANWIVVQQTGSETSSQVNCAITVTTAGLSPGTYKATLRFLTGRVPPSGSVNDATDVVYTDVHITLTVIDFAVSASFLNESLVDGQTSTSEGLVNLEIGASHHWSASSNQAWLTVNPASGTGPTALTYSINPAGLGLGTYSGTITINDDSNDTITIAVSVTVAAPLLTVTPDNVTFDVGSDTSTAALSRTVTISDQLGGKVPAKALSWTADTASTPWLSATPASGASAPATPITISIPAAQLAQLANGSYQGAVRLHYTSEDGQSQTQLITVQLNLASPLSSIAVTPASTAAVAGQGPNIDFAATGKYADGYSESLTQQVSWSSAQPAVASISNDTATIGQARALTTGTTTISATKDSVHGSATLTVSAAAGVAYVLSPNTGSVLQFLVGTDGTLAPMTASSVQAGQPMAIVFTPDGKHAYITEGNYIGPGQFGLMQFDVGADGALSPMAVPTVSLGSYAPQSISVDSTGKHVYVEECCVAAANGVIRLDIGSDGALTLSSDPPAASGSDPYSATTSPTGPYVYSVDFNGNQVWQYRIGADGALSAVGSPRATGPYPNNVVVHPSGDYVYVTNFDFNYTGEPGSVSQYTVGTNGSLSPMAMASVETLENPRAILVSSSGRLVYVVGSSGNDNVGVQTGIQPFGVEADGSLTAKTVASYDYSRYVALSPDEHFLYVTTGYDTIVEFKVAGDGTLQFSGNVTEAYDPRSIVIRKLGQ